MTALPPISASQTAWAPIEREFGELLTYQEDLERALEQTFAELNEWRSKLTEQEQRLALERNELAEQRQLLQSNREEGQVTADVTAQQLAQTQNELLSARHELSRLRIANETAAVTAQQLSQTQHELDSAKNELVSTQHELIAAQSDLARLRTANEAAASTAQQLLESQQELASTKNQLASTQHELSTSQSELARLRTANEAAERQLAELAKVETFTPSTDVAAIVAERTELELELENIRARAAQLSDTLTEARRQLMQERQQWTHERQVLRSEIEDLRAGEFTPPVPTPLATSSEAQTDGNVAWRPAAGPPAVKPTEDIVLGSVLAQFQKLGGDRRARQKRAS